MDYQGYQIMQLSNKAALAMFLLSKNNYASQDSSRREGNIYDDGWKRCVSKLSVLLILHTKTGARPHRLRSRSENHYHLTHILQHSVLLDVFNQTT